MELSEQTFAQKFDLYGCYQCGKCTGGCPVSLKSKLNIRRLMIEGILGKEPRSDHGEGGTLGLYYLQNLHPPMSPGA